MCNMKTKAIFYSLLILSNFLYAKLTVHGTLFRQHQLLQLLITTPAAHIPANHLQWIQEIIDAVTQKDCDHIKEHEILKYFSKQDAHQILKPILSKNTDKVIDDIDHYFSDTITVEIEEEITAIDYFKQDAVAMHLYETAQKVISYVQQDTLLVLGQTPAYLGAMIEEINKYNNNSMQVISIPYSGRPDTIMPRFNAKAKWNWTTASYTEILTTEREDYFRTILVQKGFDPYKYNESSKIYILDNSLGPSVASFLTIIARWYEELGLPLPDFYFICMDKKRGSLDFKMNDDLSFDIDLIYLGMDDEILNIHFDQMHDNLRIQPPFNAYAWRPETTYLFDLYPRPQAKELLTFYKEFIKREVTKV